MEKVPIPTAESGSEEGDIEQNIREQQLENTSSYFQKLADEYHEMKTRLLQDEKILEVLDEMLDDPLNVRRNSYLEYAEMRNSLRAQLQANIDTTTYLMLKNIEQHFQLIGLNEVRYKVQSEELTLCMWGLLPLPTQGNSSSSDKRPRIHCEFDEQGLSVQLPDSLTDCQLIVRALWLQYDHLSDMSRTWKEKHVRRYSYPDLLSAVLEEQRELKELLAQAAAAAAAAESSKQTSASKMDTLQSRARERGATAPPTPVGDEAKTVAAIPLRDALLQKLHDSEESQHKEMLGKCMYSLAPDELNLRKYAVLGGVLYLELLLQPSQPMIHEQLTLSVAGMNHKLHAVDFKASYVPPTQPEPNKRRLPEEIEAEMKRQEEELDKLALVSIALPETVLWFEPPTVVGWNETSQNWSTKEFHDLKFKEEKQVLTFRTSWFGPMGLVAYRYTNLPYQSWELKPDYKSRAVVFSITAAVVIVEFLVKGNKICLSQLQNGTTNALQDLVGQYFAPQKLFKLLRRGGVDLFPPDDARCYVEGGALKHPPTERHLHHCMAALSRTHNFSWSRWNLLAGYRNMVLQIREFKEKKKLANYSVLHVTPMKACIVDCTEVSQAFTEEGIAGMKFYADLFCLVQDQASPKIQKKIKEVDPILVECVYELLSSTRVLSFS